MADVKELTVGSTTYKIKDEVSRTNILYGLENGVKNVLPVVFESRTTYGITCTNNGDGSITVNGTNSQSSGTIILANIQSSVRGGYDDPRNFLGKNKDYVLVGNTTTANLRIQILGWNSSSDNSILASSTTDTVSFNTGNWNYISVRMWVQGSAAFNNLVIKPMICTAESYAQSTTYQPPALSNSALTEGLIDAIDTNGKNRLKLDIDWIKANNTQGSWSGNAYTYKGVTFTVNNDGTVSTTGTTTGDTVTFELMPYKFVSGVTYRLSGCPAGGSLSTYRLGTRGATFLRDYGLVDNTTDNVNVGDDETRNVFIYIVSANVDMTGKTYRPMLCTKAEWDTSPKFQPYALPNYDLTRLEAEDRAALAEEIDAGAKNKLNYDAWKTVAVSGGTAVWENNGVTLTSNATDCYTNYLASGFTAPISVKQGDVIVMSWDYEIASGVSAEVYIFPNGATSGNVNATIDKKKLVYTVPSGVTYITYRVGVRGSGNVAKFKNVMICTKAAFGVSNKFVPYRPNYDLVCDAVNIVDITSALTLATGYTATSRTHIFKQGKHVFGTIVVSKDSGTFPSSGAAEIGYMNAYRPKFQYVSGSFFSETEWTVASSGYAFVDSTSPGHILVTDTLTTNTFVKISIDYVVS